MEQPRKKEHAASLAVTFVGDPMCSWCYGFAPELKKLREAWHEQATFSLLVGGLRRDQTVMDTRLREYLHHHWDDVSKRTGQPFNYSILDTDLVYDTEPACRATVTARYLSSPDEKQDTAFHYFERAQKLFYQENRDPSDSETWTQLAVDMGIDADRFLAAYHSEDLQKRTREDFARSREMGVTGYPSLAAEHAGNRRFITLGYATFDVMDARLRELVNLEAS